MAEIGKNMNFEASLLSATNSEDTFKEQINSQSGGSEIADDALNSDVIGNKDKIPEEESKIILDANHPLMLKYQQDLKERLLKLLQETDEQLIDLKRTITAQEKENEHFARKAYEFQKELQIQEEKFNKITEKCDNQAKEKDILQKKKDDVKQKFQGVEENWKMQTKKDVEYQKRLEDTAFEVVQLSSLQATSTYDAKSVHRTVEKIAKDRENLELEKLRQDLLLFRLENDKYKLESKIHLYKTQWAIKKEEIADLRKELNSAHTEMELINFEKQQIVHQWKQSLASLEKQDLVVSEIRNSVRSFENDMQTLKMEIAANKKSVRKELERNEMLTVTLNFRDSDIARCEKELKDAEERENNLLENLSMFEKMIEMTENELKFLNDNRILKEKELEAKEREIQKCCSFQKSLEEKHMDILHEKITLTKSSKYTEKIIKDIRNAISLSQDTGSKKESEKEKLLMKVNNLKTYLANMENNLVVLQKESKERSTLLDKSETNVLKNREKMDLRRNEYKCLENELQELIARAGGQELAPFERELANLRKEIDVAEQGKRDMEQEYLRFQRELFTLSKQSAVSDEENDMYKKKIVIMEGKKLQLEADIVKEEKDIKDTKNRILCIEKELACINKLLGERKEIQEYLKQATQFAKSDFNQTLKEAEANNFEKQTCLTYLRRRKRKLFSKVVEAQKYIVFWEQKVFLAEETRRVLKSNDHINELLDIKNEIRRLQIKQDQIKKEQENLVQEMSRAIYRHTSLYVEADKQALYGKRRKSPQYVKKRIKHNLRKVIQDKKDLENVTKEIESLKLTKSQLNDEVSATNNLVSDMIEKIRAIEYNTDSKHQEKRQSVLKLSFKQKRSKFLEKVKNNTYIRAVRAEERRPEEISKLQNNLRAIYIIVQAAINEHPHLINDLSVILDYILISKEI